MASQRMTALWRTPEFRDNQLRSMVRRWQDPAFRRRQFAEIRAGHRSAPLARAPANGEKCPSSRDGVPCKRREAHSYHVAVTGNTKDESLRVMGWEGP
jgi:hypothetical protein